MWCKKGHSNNNACDDETVVHLISFTDCGFGLSFHDIVTSSCVLCFEYEVVPIGYVRLGLVSFAKRQI